jgi:exo-beta-1,3-glucanase (GH17 family)
MSARAVRRLLLLALAVAAAALAMASAPGARRQRPFRVRVYRQAPGMGIAYGMHRDGQRPGGASPSREQVAEDLRLIAERWRTIRVYGSTGPSETVLDVIHEERLPLQVLLGVWIESESGNADMARANREQIEGAVRLVRRHPRLVSALVVGNETQVSWTGHPVPAEQLASALRELRDRTSLPVTTADDYNFWNKPESRALAQECDFLMVHAHPLWNGRQVEDALGWTRATLDSVQRLHPDRRLVLGETGWATSRTDHGDEAKYMKAPAAEGPQAAFLDSVTAWVAHSPWPVVFFEAFDENWKGGDDPNEAEKHWGLWRADRTAKPALLR